MEIWEKRRDYLSLKRNFLSRIIFLDSEYCSGLADSLFSLPPTASRSLSLEKTVGLLEFSEMKPRSCGSP